MLGYDKRHGDDRTAGRSDTMMLLRADPTTKSISMLSFPRDLIVDIHLLRQQDRRHRQDQRAPTRSAARRARSRRSKQLTGLPINYLITVNFRGFKKIVNRIGGVWIDVDRRYFNNNVGPRRRLREDRPPARLPAAERADALDYVRYRHTDSDFYRIARQQQFVKAMKQQIATGFSVSRCPSSSAR